MDLAARLTKRALVKEAHVNDTKKLGKLKFDEPTVEMKLSDELEGSLRLLKVFGNKIIFLTNCCRFIKLI